MGRGPAEGRWLEIVESQDVAVDVAGGAFCSTPSLFSPALCSGPGACPLPPSSLSPLPFQLSRAPRQALPVSAIPESAPRLGRSRSSLQGRRTPQRPGRSLPLHPRGPPSALGQAPARPLARRWLSALPVSCLKPSALHFSRSLLGPGFQLQPLAPAFCS